MDDLISRQAAIYALTKLRIEKMQEGKDVSLVWKCLDEVLQVPSVQPTLYGYDIKHLMLIAEVLRKENLPPERVTEALTDIGQVVAVVVEEFEETLRKSVEQCMI